MDKSPSKKDEEEEKRTEVKVNIDESKLFEKKISIFGSRKENDEKMNIFANTKSVNLFNLAQSKPTQGAINIFSQHSNSQPSISNK